MNESVSVKPSKKRRWKWVLAALVVLVLGGVGAGVYWFGYPVSLSSFGHPFADRLASLESTLDARVDERVQSQLKEQGYTANEWISRTEWSQAATESKEHQAQIDQQIADLFASLNELKEAQQKSRVTAQQLAELSDEVNALSAEVATLGVSGRTQAEPVPVTEIEMDRWAQEKLALVDAWVALRTASIQIEMGQQDAALEAYRQAELALAPLDGAALVAIKQSLAEEQSVLSAWAALDWRAWQDKVMGALASASPSVAASAGSMSTEAATDEVNLSAWAKFKRAMGQLVTVRSRTSDEALTPADGMLFDAALRYQWMALEVAMLSRDLDEVQAQARRIQAWLARSGSTEDVAHRSLSDLLAQLIELNAPEAPAELGQTARAIQAQWQ